MARKALIRLRSKPRKPQRRTIEYTTDIYDGQTLAEAMRDLGCEDPSQILITKDYSYYNGHDDYSYDVTLRHSREQTDEEYEEELAAYHQRLEKYNQWYEENREVIEEELERRKQELAKSSVAAIQRQEKLMQKRKAHLEKELARLEKKLQK